MNDLSKRICKGIRFVVISSAGLRNFFNAWFPLDRNGIVKSCDASMF